MDNLEEMGRLAPNKQNSRNFASQVNSNIERRVSTYPSQTVSENWRGKNISEHILWGQLHPDTKTKDTTRKDQAYATDEHRCKNLQQNINKPNLAIH